MDIALMMNMTYVNHSFLSFNDTSYFNVTDTHRAHIPLSFRIARLALFILVFIIGVPGHITVLHIMCFRYTSKIPYHIFMCALSITDLFVLCIHLPFFLLYVELPHSLIFTSRFVCPTFYSISLASVIASALLLTAISYDRFRVSVHPMEPKLTSRHVSLVLFAIFLSAMLLTVPFAAAMGPMSFPSGVKVECFIRPQWWPNSWSRSLTYFTNSFVPSCLAPSMLMSFYYSKIVSCLRDKRQTLLKRGNFSSNATILRLKRDSKLTRLFIAVCVCFTFCTLPFQLIMFIVSFNPNIVLKIIPILELSRFLLIANSSLNPLLYNLFSSNFRAHFRSLFTCKKRAQNKSPKARVGVLPHYQKELLEIQVNNRRLDEKLEDKDMPFPDIGLSNMGQEDAADRYTVSNFSLATDL